MGETKITSLTAEVTHRAGSATVVIREPGTVAQRVYIAGDLPAHLAEEVVQRLGLDQQPASVAERGATSVRQPPAPSSVSAAELAAGPDSAPEELERVLEELASAVLRAGRHHPTSTVDELLGRAWSVGRGRVVVARALARLEEGLAPDTPPVLAALALAALGELVSALREGSGALWLELLNQSEALESCTLVEVGRQRERGAVRWETRLLLDTASGNLFREEGSLGERRLSRGSVGRCVSVTLGRRQAGLSPARIQIQQYEYEPAPSRELLERLASLASPGLPELSTNGLELVLVPRPAWLLATALEIDRGACWLCSGETRVVLSDSPLAGATAALLEQLQEGSEVRAMAGSLEHRAHEGGTSLVFVPWSALVEERDGLRLVALRG